MLTIHQRPFQPDDRSQPGHWEGDLIIGKDGGSAIGTLVERKTRLVRLLHLPQRDGDTLHDALKARMADLPAALLRSITWDQGTEMARHITKSLGAPVYFCDSRSPWQRGTNENTNGLLRDYFPKGTDLSTHSPQHLLAVENELNNRPQTRPQRPRAGRALRGAASRALQTMADAGDWGFCRSGAAQQAYLRTLSAPHIVKRFGSVGFAPNLATRSGLLVGTIRLWTPLRYAICRSRTWMRTTRYSTATGPT
jgi:hypothetical protein